MIKIENKHLQQIKQVAEVCNKVGFESFIIDKESARAASSSIIMCTPFAEGDFQYNLAISRIPLFLSRLSLIKDIAGDEYESFIETFDNRDYVKKIVLKAKKTSIDFTCAKPEDVKAYKTAKDILFYELNITDETFKVMSAMKSTMAGEKIVNITWDGSVVKLFCIDNSSDGLQHDLTSRFSKLPECDKNSFAFSYDLNTILPILQENVGKSIYISKRGLLKMHAANNIFFIVPGV
jgi:hypothetical protein